MGEEEDVDFGFTGDEETRTGELGDDYDLSTSQLDMGEEEEVDFGFAAGDEDTRAGEVEGFDLSTADLDAAADEGAVDFGFTGERTPAQDDEADEETDWDFLDEVDDEDVADFDFDEDSDTPDADAFLASLLDTRGRAGDRYIRPDAGR